MVENKKSIAEIVTQMHEFMDESYVKVLGDWYVFFSDQYYAD